MDEHTARYAELVLAMDQTVDENALLRLVAEAEEILADQVVVIPLFTRGHVVVVREGTRTTINMVNDVTSDMAR